MKQVCQCGNRLINRLIPYSALGTFALTYESDPRACVNICLCQVCDCAAGTPNTKSTVFDRVRARRLLMASILHTVVLQLSTSMTEDQTVCVSLV